MTSRSPEDADSRPFGSSRQTAQRRRIADAVPSGAFTVEELAALVAERDPRTGLATVYRAVAAMEAAGWLARVGDRGGSALYARCSSTDHHHHVVCTACGRIEHAPCPLGLSAAVATTGFRLTDHAVTLYGLCPECDEGPAS